MSTTLRIGNLSHHVEREATVIDRLILAVGDPTITIVCFWNVEFTTSIIEALKKLLHCDARRFTIKILSCRGLVADAVSTLVVTTNQVADPTRSAGVVDTLVLNGPILENSTAIALRGQKSLKSLRLLGIRSEYHDAIDIGQCSEVDLTHSKLFMAPECSLIGSLARSHHLKCLILDFCSLSDSEVSRMVQVCPNTTLRELHLSHNKCSSAAINALVNRMLKQPASSLAILNLRRQITRISIPWQLLFEALRYPYCKLQELDISGNSIDELEATVLSESLKTNTALKCLRLQDCRLSPQSISKLALEMPKFTASLQTLDLSGGSFLRSQQSVLDGLKRNYYLESIGNRSYYPFTSEVEYYLDCNRCGRRLLRSPNNIPLGLWPNLLARASRDLPVLFSGQNGQRLGRRESTIYYFLRYGMMLCQR